MANPGGERAATDRWPMVGRHRELAAATDALGAPHRWGLIISGPPGVGKSCLADEIAAQVAAGGRRVRRVIATESVGEVPFGAVAHLLPATAEVDPDGQATGGHPLDLIRQVRAALEDGATEPLLLVIDDAHFLDPASTTLLAHLASDEAAKLVVTSPTVDALPDGLDHLARTGRLAQVSLDVLSNTDVEALIHLALGAPVEGLTMSVLHESCSGNPLLLREVVMASLRSGVLQQLDGVWHLTGPLPHVGLLSEAMTRPLEHLDAIEREVVELLALAGPSALDLMLELADLDVLERLEAVGLLELHPPDAPGEPDRLALAHPQAAHHVRNGVSPIRRRRLLAAHADRMERVGPPTDDALLRIVAWRVAAGRQLDPDDLDRASHTARERGDRRLCLELATAADTLRPSLASGLLVAESCFYLGVWSQAEDAYVGCLDRIAEPTDHAAVTSLRAANLHLGLGRTDEACELLREELRRLDALDPTDGVERARIELRSRLGQILVHQDDPHGALELVGGSPPVGERGHSMALWAAAAAPALTLMGRTGQAIAAAAAAWDARVRSHPPDPGWEEANLVSMCHALADHGRLHEAEDLAAMGYDAAVLDGSLTGQVWSALHRGRCALVRGHPATAARWFREARSLCSASGWTAPAGLASAGLDAAAALGGVREASPSADHVTHIQGLTFLTAERALAAAWVAAAADRHDDALRALDEGAAYARARGLVPSESWLLHEMASRGASRRVLGRMQELAASCESPLVAARAAHVEASASASRVGLIAAAEQLESHGCDLPAAEALAAAADVAKTERDQRAATHLLRRAAELLGRCEGARTVRPLAATNVVALSTREREIVTLAASGLSNREIGSRLVISVRTVENHLQNAYTKLGVSSRRDLAAALDTPPAPDT